MSLGALTGPVTVIGEEGCGEKDQRARKPVMDDQPYDRERGAGVPLQNRMVTGGWRISNGKP